MYAFSSPAARRASSSMATRRLRAASPRAHAPTARPIVKTVSSAVAVKKLVADRAMSATRPTSETLGGRAAASEPTANRPATGKTTSGASSQIPKPPARATAITHSG